MKWAPQFTIVKLEHLGALIVYRDPLLLWSQMVDRSWTCRIFIALCCWSQDEQLLTEDKGCWTAVRPLLTWHIGNGCFNQVHHKKNCLCKITVYYFSPDSIIFQIVIVGCYPSSCLNNEWRAIFWFVKLRFNVQLLEKVKHHFSKVWVHDSMQRFDTT